MAVSVDTVYQRVLAIANKEQRGYITPQEFNLLANQAQLEIFEQYFYDINQFNRQHGNSTEFSDMLSILDEKISPFRVNGASLTAASIAFEDTFESDITGWTEAVADNGIMSHETPSSSNNYDGGLKILQNSETAAHVANSGNFTLTATKKYVLKWSITSMDEPAYYSVAILDSGSSAVKIQDYEPEVAAHELTFVADTTGTHSLQLTCGDTSNAGKFLVFGNISITEVDDTTLAANVYRLGEVFYKASGASYPTTIARVNSNEATLFNLSPLARPTTSNLAYVRSSDTSITIYPTTLGASSTVTYNYIKKPTTVAWGYAVVLGNALYNSTNSTDFELHPSEENTLVMKILELAGIAMNKPEITQIAMNKNAQETQQEKA